MSEIEQVLDAARARLADTLCERSATPRWFCQECNSCRLRRAIERDIAAMELLLKLSRHRSLIDVERSILAPLLDEYRKEKP